jgi:tRNA (cmo5U34)-methyltransferase
MNKNSADFFTKEAAQSYDERNAKLPTLLKDALTVFAPAETETLIRQSGIDCPVPFFQALMIHGWYGKKES